MGSCWRVLLNSRKAARVQGWLCRLVDAHPWASPLRTCLLTGGLETIPSWVSATESVSMPGQEPGTLQLRILHPEAQCNSPQTHEPGQPTRKEKELAVDRVHSQPEARTKRCLTPKGGFSTCVLFNSTPASERRTPAMAASAAPVPGRSGKTAMGDRWGSPAHGWCP